MGAFWLMVVVVGCLFLPSPVSAWGRAQIKKIWRLVFKKRTDVAV